VGLIGDAIATLIPSVGASGPGFATDINALLTEFKTRLTQKITGAALSLTLPGSRSIVQVDGSGNLTAGAQLVAPLSHSSYFRQVPATLHFNVSGSSQNFQQGGVGSASSACTFVCPLISLEQGERLKSIKITAVINITGSTTFVVKATGGTASTTLQSFTQNMTLGNPSTLTITLSSPYTAVTAQALIIECSIPTSTDRVMCFDVEYDRP